MHPAALPEGRLARMERGAIHDGPGLRTVLFLKGCPLHCFWCHSPETQSSGPEILTHPERCLECGACASRCPAGAAGPQFGPAGIDRMRCAACGACADVCPASARVLAGRRVTVAETMTELLRDRPFFDQSGGGVTLSGGEPLIQPGFVLAILERCRAERVHTAIETCGLVNGRVLLEAAALADLFLFDLKLRDAERHRGMTGRSNRRILANLAALASVHPHVRARIPLVPGINDGQDNIAGLGVLLTGLGIRSVDLLPYHRAGAAKYSRLGLEYSLPHVEAPSPAAIASAADTLRACGLTVHIGGMS